MVRWTLLIVGMLSVAMHLVVRIQRPPLSEIPVPMTVAQAVDYTLGPRDGLKQLRQFVSMKVSLESDIKIYPSKIDTPGYTLRRTGQVYPFDIEGSESEEIRSYLGNVIETSATADAMYLSLRTVSSDDDEIQGERVLAPLAGTKNLVWVLSKAYKSSSMVKGFLNQRRFRGAVSEFRFLNENLSSLKFEHEMEEIYQRVKEDLLIEIPENAIVILSEVKPRRENSIYWHSPIENSDGILYLEMRDSIQEKFNGEVIGMLEPWGADAYSKLFEFRRKVLVPGGEDPERLGLIDWSTAAYYNEKNQSTLQSTKMTSLFCLPLAILLFWRKRRKQSKS